MTSDDRVFGARLGRRAARRLADTGLVAVAPGLTDVEFRRVEEGLGFAFAPEHRAFLAAGLPVTGPWPDWRHDELPDLRDRLRTPMRTILFEVRSGRWHPALGDRPDDLDDAVAAAEAVLAAAPTLVPVHGVRCLPSIPDETGHPVLSARGLDVVVLATDLADYVDTEFGARPTVRDAAPVPFWGALAV